jgi:hypothetical protein
MFTLLVFMKVVHFSRWAEILKTDSLSSQEREGYAVTIRWYLSWCRKCCIVCAVESAKDFVSWAQAEKTASEWAMGRWKDVISWFSVMAKRQATSGASAGSHAPRLYRPESPNADCKRRTVTERRK